MNRNKRIHANKKKYVTRTAAIGMAALTGLTPVMATPVLAADDAGVTKDETVYVNASADGKASDITVSDHLSGSTDGKIKDASTLKDIQNVKGDETFSGTGDSMTWDGAGTDIYYQGTSSEDLPVSVKMTYYLDGKEIAPEDLAGKSGKVKIKVEYTNNSKKTVTVNGKEKEVTSPFVMMTGMILPTDHFANVTVDNGKVLGDGSRNVVVGFGLPGLADSLDLEGMKDKLNDSADSVKDSKEKVKAAKDDADEEDAEDSGTKEETGSTDTADAADSKEADAVVVDKEDTSESESDDAGEDASASDTETEDTDAGDENIDEIKDKLDDFSIPEGFEVEADVTDFQLDSTYTVASNESLGDFDLKDIDSLDDLDEAITSLKDATDQLVEGSQELADGTETLNDKYAELNNGIYALENGAVALNSGIGQYTSGVAQATAGAKQLNDGMQAANDGINTLSSNLPALASGVQQLNDGAKDLADGSAELNDGVKTYVDGTVKFVNSVNSLNQLNFGIASLANSMNSLDTTLNNVNQTAAAGRAQALTDAQRTATTEVVQNGNKPTDSDITTKVQGQAIADGANDLKKQIGTASDGANTIKSSLDDLASELAKAKAASKAPSNVSTQSVNLDFTQLNSQIDQAQADSEAAADAAAQAAADATVANTGTVDRNAVSQQVSAQASQQATDQTNAALASAQASVNAALAAEQAKGDAADPNVIASLQAALGALNPTTVTVNVSADSIPSGGSVDTEAVKATVKSAVSNKLNTAGNYDEIRASIQQLEAGASDSKQTSTTAAPSDADVAASLKQARQAADDLQKTLNGMNDNLTAVDSTTNMNGATQGAMTIASIENNFQATTNPDLADSTKLSAEQRLQEQISSLNTQASSLSANYSTVLWGALASGSAALTDKDTVDGLKDGAAQVAAGAQGLYAGTNRLYSNSAKLIAGAAQLQTGSQQLADGSSSLLAGLLKLSSNSAALKDGSSQLATGLTTAADGSKQVSDGISELNDGAQKLAEGTQKYKESGIDVLTDTLDDTLGNFKDIKDNLEAVTSDDAQYTNYSGAADGMKTSVKFIIATDAVKNS